MDEDRYFLTSEEAIAMLRDGDYIHTFRNRFGMLVGADIDRDTIVMKIIKFAPELSGETASAMGHKIALHDDIGFLFIETKDKT